MPLSEMQNIIIGSCEDCNSTVYWDEDNERIRFTCPCGVVDPNTLPDWVKLELELDACGSVQDDRDEILESIKYLTMPSPEQLAILKDMHKDTNRVISSYMINANMIVHTENGKCVINKEGKSIHA